MLRRKLVGSPLLARAPASNRSASSMLARAMPDAITSSHALALAVYSLLPEESRSRLSMVFV